MQDVSGQDKEPEISPEDQAWLDDCFLYHSPSPDQGERLYEVSGAAKEFAAVILRYVPKSADRSAALRCLRECRMWANAAIVLEGRR